MCDRPRLRLWLPDVRQAATTPMAAAATVPIGRGNWNPLVSLAPIGLSTISPRELEQTRRQSQNAASLVWLPFQLMRIDGKRCHQGGCGFGSCPAILRLSFGIDWSFPRGAFPQLPAPPREMPQTLKQQDLLSRSYWQSSVAAAIEVR
jgi:hypothetical protein